MYTMTIPKNEKAGHSGQRRPATNTTCKQAYTSPRPASTPFRRFFPGRRDRTPPAQPTRAPTPPSAASCDNSPLGLLVLLLSARSHELPAHQARRGWRLAQDWLAAFVAARHAEVVI